MRLKILALAVLIAVGVAALGVSVGGLGAGTTTATEYLTSDAALGDVTDEVAATGSLAAATTVRACVRLGPRGSSATTRTRPRPKRPGRSPRSRSSPAIR